MPRSDLPAGL